MAGLIKVMPDKIRLVPEYMTIEWTRFNIPAIEPEYNA
jgi:hypothetical protein